MNNNSIMERLAASGLPEEKAAEITVRCITNQNGPVTKNSNGNAKNNHSARG